MVAAISTAILLVIGYPVAYAMARLPQRWQAIAMMLVIVPFWTSFLIRIYAWINILQHDGLLNTILLKLHLVSAPVVWLSTDSAMYIGIVYSYLPFMILPLYATLAKMDPALLEAAGDLGATPQRGVLAGDVPAVVARGRRRRAALLHSHRRRIRDPGSSGGLRLADDRPDPVAANFSPTRTGRWLRQLRWCCWCCWWDRWYFTTGCSAASWRGVDDARALTPDIPFNITSLALGFAFLYLPIVILVIYSFNASRLVTVWGGWSTRWYTEFFNDRAMLDAAWMSLRVATVSATIATILGTLAAIALTRAERFRGRTLFSGMLYAPLVMPEVITGLSLLLLFVAAGAERGFWTVTIAHTTLTMCFVAVVVQSRLAPLDRSLEEAAMDLGCDPVQAFLSVTLPLILPSIAAGWMLAFTLSLDDVVIASFTTGPGSATLPIRIYSEVRLGVKPEINAICTLVLGLIAVVIVAASLASKLSSARGESAAPL